MVIQNVMDMVISTGVVSDHKNKRRCETHIHISMITKFFFHVEKVVFGLKIGRKLCSF